MNIEANRTMTCVQIRQWKERVSLFTAMADDVPGQDRIVTECEFEGPHNSRLTLQFPDPRFVPAVGDKFTLNLNTKE